MSTTNPRIFIHGNSPARKPRSSPDAFQGLGEEGLVPGLVFAVPTIVFLAGVSFAVGEWTRRPILLFFLRVAELLICAFSLCSARTLSAAESWSLTASRLTGGIASSYNYDANGKSDRLRPLVQRRDAAVHHSRSEWFRRRRSQPLPL